jgi:hypothetical protein
LKVLATDLTTMCVRELLYIKMLCDHTSDKNSSLIAKFIRMPTSLLLIVMILKVGQLDYITTDHF